MKIVLADDEQMLRLGMIDMLEELGLPGVTILQARNGKELLAIAQRERPEIAYIDIKMPVMDGLEAFSQMKTVSPKTKCFILTGYAEFQYVQTAIHHGALDYLLKPVTLEALRASLDRAGAELQSTWEQVNMGLNILIAGYFGSVCAQIPTEISESDFSAPFDVSLIYLSKEACRPAMIRCLHQYESRMKAAQSGHYALCHLLADGTPCIVTEKKDMATAECLAAFQRDLQAAGCSIFSADAQRLCEVPARVSDTEKRAALRLLRIPGEAPVPSIQENEQICLFCKSLYETVLSFEQENRFLFDGWIARLEGIQTYEFENPDYLRALKYHFELLAPAKSIAMIPKLLRQLGEKQFACCEKTGLPEAVKAYIDRNYHMDIGTNILADTFNISPNYLSGIFKKRYQIGLLAYLTQVRMYKARLLLQKEANIPIWKVAAAVGYSNPGYFSKVFRQTFGVLPSDFH